jgi:hypothetical protein
MRIGECLPKRLREGDGLRIVPNILEQGEDGDAVLQACRSNTNAHCTSASSGLEATFVLS